MYEDLEPISDPTGDSAIEHGFERGFHRWEAETAWGGTVGVLSQTLADEAWGRTDDD